MRENKWKFFPSSVLQLAKLKGGHFRLDNRGPQAQPKCAKKINKTKLIVRGQRSTSEGTEAEAGVHCIL